MAFPQSTVEAVRRLKAAGRSTAEIAMAVGLTPIQVGGLCHTRGIKKRYDGRIDVAVGTKLVEAYAREAALHGMKFDQFMKLILVTIVKDNLFAAILDDGK